MSLAGGNISGLQHIYVKNAEDALGKMKTHRPRVKKAMDLSKFKIILTQIEKDYIGKNLKTILLFLYYGGFRQCEILPRTIKSFNSQSCMTRGDIKVYKDCLVISLRWAKNIKTHKDQREIKLPKISDNSLCPRRAYKSLLKLSPTSHHTNPVFMAENSVSPIPVSLIRKLWNRALYSVKLDKNIYSLHSIRKMAASQAFSQGASSLEVQRWGGWHSDAHKIYIDTQASTKVTRALESAITQ